VKLSGAMKSRSSAVLGLNLEAEID